MNDLLELFSKYEYVVKILMMVFAGGGFFYVIISYFSASPEMLDFLKLDKPDIIIGDVAIYKIPFVALLMTCSFSALLGLGSGAAMAYFIIFMIWLSQYDLIIMSTVGILALLYTSWRVFPIEHAVLIQKEKSNE